MEQWCRALPGDDARAPPNARNDVDTFAVHVVGVEYVSYIEFIVFQSSEAFRQHRLTVSEGTAQMKQAMNEHVVLERVSISAYGKIAEQEKAVLRMMGASLYEYKIGRAHV